MAPRASKRTKAEPHTTPDASDTALGGPVSPDEVFDPSGVPLDVPGPHTASEGELEAFEAPGTRRRSPGAGSEAVAMGIAEKLRQGLPLTPAEKQMQAVTLRMGGATYRRIGEIMGIEHSYARRLVVAALKEQAQDSVEDLRLTQFARYEHMLMLLWPKVNKANGEEPGDQAAAQGAMHTALAIMDRENSLMGLGASNGPGGITVTGNTIIANGMKEEFIEALRAARELPESKDDNE